MPRITATRKANIAMVREKVRFDHRLTLMLLWSLMRHLDDDSLDEMVQFGQEWRAQTKEAQLEFFEGQAAMPIE